MKINAEHIAYATLSRKIEDLDTEKEEGGYVLRRFFHYNEFIRAKMIFKRFYITL
ncbi:hypothetical protein J8L85_00425 [Maribacter sp. MMG018]|uniref:hypothetical protein n=1 Tax=Maribacter sp. MMG018 TaxID=2822688 RepID=UPI001B395D50|nr:hypothetical protein [Maribacter sp. MMG018]MBQ4912880.1 hypothetical protein [Maribacter sp. MMG018]